MAHFMVAGYTSGQTGKLMMAIGKMAKSTVAWNPMVKLLFSTDMAVPAGKESTSKQTVTAP